MNLTLLAKALRLWPPVPSNMRVATTDTVLPRGGGPKGEDPVHVPKGCTVTYTVYAMHRRPDLFGVDADKWRPERWDGQTYGWVSPYLPLIYGVAGEFA